MRLVVTGGGTGGHIYPAIEIAKEMIALLPKTKVLFIGTADGMESNLVPKEGLEFAAVRSGGIMGKSAKAAAKGALRAARGLSDARKTLKSWRPDVVVGTGGYASGPVVFSAYGLGIPRAIQEQNAVPGKTNLLLSRVCGRVFAAWEYSRHFFPNEDKVLVTGNPVRRDILTATRETGRAHYGIPSSARVVLVTGGSRGAKTLYEVALAMSKNLPAGTYLVLIAGRDYYDRAVEALDAVADSGIDGAVKGNIIIRPYEHNMAMAYGAADLVVARAGGMTLSEVTALGLPSVIIPSPNVAGNHQEHNARTVSQAGAAEMFVEAGDVADKAAGCALAILDDKGRLSAMREASLRVGKPMAAETICRELAKMARRA